MEKNVMMYSNFPNLQLLGRGKVRDIYDLDEYLLIVTTDRISAFDVVMPNPIPGKGEILNQMSALWFKKTAFIISNHMITCDPAQYPEICLPYTEELKGQSMLVRKVKPLPVECVARGYISGSGWKSYQADGTVCGIELPSGLLESQKLPTPIFTPTTKAESDHDPPITYNELEEEVGKEMAGILKAVSLTLYNFAQSTALKAGIIIADTKFEFGLIDGKLILIDELLTPDSSRFWPVDSYQPGKPQRSFDKQFLRDWLLSIKWNQKPPAPELPKMIINKTLEKYVEAYKRLAKVLAI